MSCDDAVSEGPRELTDLVRWCPFCVLWQRQVEGYRQITDWGWILALALGSLGLGSSLNFSFNLLICKIKDILSFCDSVSLNSKIDVTKGKVSMHAINISQFFFNALYYSSKNVLGLKKNARYRTSYRAKTQFVTSVIPTPLKPPCTSQRKPRLTVSIFSSFRGYHPNLIMCLCYISLMISSRHYLLTRHYLLLLKQRSTDSAHVPDGL